MRKYSILSLILVGASAVTAAFIPSKTIEADDEFVVQPSTTAEGAFDFTCAPGVDGVACTYTATSAPNAPGSSTSDNSPVGDNSDTGGGDQASGTGTTI